MKRIVTLAAIAAIVAGCTGFKKNSKTGEFSYVNGLFSKQFSKGKYTEERRDTNGVITIITLDLEGYKSEAERLTEAAVRGAVQGAKSGP